MTLYVNGFRVAFWRIYDMDKKILQAEIEPEYWLSRHGGAYAKCVWHLPNSVRPSDLTDADDQRQIGFCFRHYVANTTAVDTRPIFDNVHVMFLSGAAPWRSIFSFRRRRGR